jgi:hypothetical protein
MSNDSSGNPDELSSGGSRYHQVYPTLDERQLAILERYGERRKLKTDDILPKATGTSRCSPFSLERSRRPERPFRGPNYWAHMAPAVSPARLARSPAGPRR